MSARTRTAVLEQGGVTALLGAVEAQVTQLPALQLACSALEHLTVPGSPSSFPRALVPASSCAREQGWPHASWLLGVSVRCRRKHCPCGGEPVEHPVPRGSVAPPSQCVRNGGERHFGSQALLHAQRGAARGDCKSAGVPAAAALCRHRATAHLGPGIRLIRFGDRILGLAIHERHSSDRVFHVDLL